ncbi:helix-turn-helix transcriptional regulator [Streptomyces sp. RS10V-4]|uniref:helix-turn-helix transcriptional regulator n=1 Tax=Streptomyces rhizoryzae TaxID=2932493 RepID=UPI002005DF9D|nr:helix-turn-helix transcriptional regulator [Streptomyces rhizoryzae]MCK7628097.1 helix-turn-helix transcriptional regulator [Streptomyces rhizoryzae]
MAATTAAADAEVRRRQELRAFLRSRRARVTPAEAGLPDGGRRRTPGLRREEVAVLAGVGASWYQWLEQGRDITVSPQVLDAVARVLRLSGAERRHLYALAGLNPPPRRDGEDREPGSGGVGAGLQRLIDAWMPSPAHITDPYWNTIASNEAARIVLGHGRPGASPNCLIAFFTDPFYRARTTSWEANAPRLVAQYRAACSARAGDEGFAEVVAETAARSAEFAALWARGDVQDGGQLLKEMEHPRVGALLFETTQLQVPDRPDLSVMLYNPRPETGTAAKLEWLTSPEGRRGGLYPVAG